MGVNCIFENVLFSYIHMNACQWEQANEDLTNPVFLEEFFNKNEQDLLEGFYKGTIDNVTDAVSLTIKMAYDFFDQVLDCCESGISLDKVFKHLDKIGSKKDELKFKARNEKECNWLRLYAIKIEDGIYMVTGGAIKLTEKMQDREHTNYEYLKLGYAKDFIANNMIIDKEAILDYMESL